MEYAVGVILAIAVGLFASLVGFDKERSFYPTVLIVIAAYYLLFAAMAKSTDALLAEVLPMLLFGAAAAVGFQRTLWIVAAAPGTPWRFRSDSPRRHQQPGSARVVAGLLPRLRSDGRRLPGRPACRSTDPEYGVNRRGRRDTHGIYLESCLTG